ncbi:hypothetical protein [Sphingomonas sp.]|uniref:hypothetical protein n=1 Tax=Sphingomonas sp. TaxID=28214 RepID=UPI0025F7F9CE|nr:hypothetical protein [Sphingomonas sp.]
MSAAYIGRAFRGFGCECRRRRGSHVDECEMVGKLGAHPADGLDLRFRNTANAGRAGDVVQLLIEAWPGSCADARPGRAEDQDQVVAQRSWQWGRRFRGPIGAGMHAASGAMRTIRHARHLHAAPTPSCLSPHRDDRPQSIVTRGLTA